MTRISITKSLISMKSNLFYQRIKTALGPSFLWLFLSRMWLDYIIILYKVIVTVVVYAFSCGGAFSLCARGV